MVDSVCGVFRFFFMNSCSFWCRVMFGKLNELRKFVLVLVMIVMFVFCSNGSMVVI